MKDYPDGVPHAGSNAAHTMAEIDAVIALRPLYGAVMDCEGHSITLPKRDDLNTTLHPRALFGQDELATCEVRAGLRKKNRDLNREGEISIKILVETVEIPRDILQQ